MTSAFKLCNDFLTDANKQFVCSKSKVRKNITALTVSRQQTPVFSIPSSKIKDK